VCKCEGKGHVGDLVVDGKIILKINKQYDGKKAVVPMLLFLC
jgi:hypothetical protein